MLNLGLGGAAFAQRVYYPDSVEAQRNTTVSSQRQAARMVRQAYRDILRREPDSTGMQQYMNALLYEGWTETDRRRALRSSPEYAELRGTGSYGLSRTGYRTAYRHGGNSQAASIVRRTYLGVLGREPDAVGMRDYTTRIVRDGWSENDVVRALRSSPEYRIRFR
jgi:TorA maturation chaperone TorD